MIAMEYKGVASPLGPSCPLCPLNKYTENIANLCYQVSDRVTTIYTSHSVSNGLILPQLGGKKWQKNQMTSHICKWSMSPNPWFYWAFHHWWWRCTIRAPPLEINLGSKRFWSKYTRRKKTTYCRESKQPLASFRRSIGERNTWSLQLLYCYLLILVPTTIVHHQHSNIQVCGLRPRILTEDHTGCGTLGFEVHTTRNSQDRQTL